MPVIKLQDKSLFILCPKTQCDVTIEGCNLCSSMKQITFSRVECKEESAQEKPVQNLKDNLIEQEKKEAPPGKKLNIVYFDLETKKLIDTELQKVDLDPIHFRNLGMSVGVTQSTRDGEAVYTEDIVQSLIHQLLVADAIVGFNHVNFDYVVLSAYMNDEQIKNLNQVKTLDMMLSLQERLGHRVSLDSCVTTTLGDQKSASGVQAVEWFQHGEIEKVIEYCKKDVNVTRRLYEFGCQHNYIKFTDKYKAQTRQIYVDWTFKD